LAKVFIKHFTNFSLGFFLKLLIAHMHFEVQLLQREKHIAKKDLEIVVVNASKSFVEDVDVKHITIKKV
jgi:hypothetical protein